MQDICNDIALDSQCNLYCAGQTQGSLGEANGGGILTDAFISKTDTNGNLLWIKQLGSVTAVPGGDTAQADSCFKIAIDEDDNIYCAGYTQGSLGEANGGQTDIFVWKLNSAGTTTWIKQFGAITKGPQNDTAGTEQPSTLKIDKNGDLVIGAYTTSSFAEPLENFFNFLVLKLNSDGNLVWATQFGTNTVVPGGSNQGVSIAFDSVIDSNNDIIFAGASIYFGGGGGFAEPQSSTVNFNYDSLIIKLDTNGGLKWATQLGANTTYPGGDNTSTDYCQGVAVDSNDNIYCTGLNYGSLIENKNGSGDVYILKLNSAGQLAGGVQFGTVSEPAGTSTAGQENATDIVIDNEDNLFIQGYINGSFIEANSGLNDIFVLKLDSNLTLLDSIQLGATTSLPGGDNTASENTGAMIVDAAGNLYLSGYTTGNFIEANAGTTDIWFIKFKNDLSL